MYLGEEMVTCFYNGFDWKLNIYVPFVWETVKYYTSELWEASLYRQVCVSFIWIVHLFLFLNDLLERGKHLRLMKFAQHRCLDGFILDDGKPKVK
jgi:hypothetical protein